MKQGKGKLIFLQITKRVHAPDFNNEKLLHLFNYKKVNNDDGNKCKKLYT
jgi:hypothetical protein